MAVETKPKGTRKAANLGSQYHQVERGGKAMRRRGYLALEDGVSGEVGEVRALCLMAVCVCVRRRDELERRRASLLASRCSFSSFCLLLCCFERAATASWAEWRSSPEDDAAGAALHEQSNTQGRI